MATLSQLTRSEEGAITQPPSPASVRLRKKLVRRVAPDHSQLWRRGFQVAFLLLNIWVGASFYLWVRAFETGSPLRTARPAGVEGWLPIAGLMNFRYCLTAGRLPATHPAALFLFITFVAIAFLLRKAFCSWPCRNFVGISLARRTPDLWPQLSTAPLAGHSAAQLEVSSARLLCLGRGQHVLGRGRAVHA